MPKPTKAALGKHPKAVVLLARSVADPTKIDYDFEWFETDEGVNTFLTDAIPYADEDVRDHGDLHHLLVEVTDTKMPPTIGRTHGASVDADFLKAWTAEIAAKPELIVAPTATRAPASTSKVKPKIRPKQPSAAAAVLKEGEAEGNTAMAAKAAKSAELKQRLAAKKAAEAKPEADGPDVDTAPAPKPKAKPKAAEAQQHLYALGWAIPLGRGTDGKFRSIR